MLLTCHHNTTMLSGTKKLVLIAMFAVFFIILVNLAWWFYYQKTAQLLDDQLSRRLSAVAASASVMIGPLKIDGLLTGDIEAYAHVTSLLADLQVADSLAELFILDEDYRYLATTAIEPDTTYFLAALNGRYIDSLFFGRSSRPVVTPTYRTGRLFLKSAFAPLYGPEGYVMAVLGVEANVDYFDVLAELRRNLWYASLFSVLGGLILGAVFLLLQRRVGRAEQQLFLGQTHAYLGRMVAVVAHELKNPLMIIRGSAERLVKTGDAPEARYVVEEVDRLNRIVSGYLEFARADRSLLSADPPEDFDPIRLLADTKKHFMERYRAEQVSWLSPEPGGSTSMVGHPRALRQVLLNLLFNGAEACQQAGKPIAVGIEMKDRAALVELAVIDHGAGMSRKEARKAFTPFFTTKQKGSGLGLYLSRKIIAEMGGDIEIRSVVGEETRIVIRLPRKPKT